MFFFPSSSLWKVGWREHWIFEKVISLCWHVASGINANDSSSTNRKQLTKCCFSSKRLFVKTGDVSRIERIEINFVSSRLYTSKFHACVICAISPRAPKFPRGRMLSIDERFPKLFFTHNQCERVSNPICSIRSSLDEPVILIVPRSFISPYENVPGLSVCLWSNHPIISVTWSLTGPSSVFDINEGQQRAPIKQSEVKSASIPLHRSFVLSSNVKDGDIQRHPLPIIKCQSTSESTNSNFTKFLSPRGARV